MVPARRPLLALGAAVALAVLSIELAHCGRQAGAGPGESASDASTEGQTPACGELGSPCAFDEAGVPTCNGVSSWHCAVDTTCASESTMLTGKVFDPAGNAPLYNAIVFISSDVRTLPPLAPGTSACTCTQPIGDFVAVAATDATGAFTLKGVPTARGVPVTVQTGKWRRTVYVNIPASCATNTVPDGTLRLPRRRSEGDMPQMAVVTGGFDNLGCFLRRVGIDPSEYSAPRAGGRLDVYRGVAAAAGVMTGTGPGLSSGVAGDCTTAACPLWASKSALEYYDTILLSCEGDPYVASKPPAAIQVMHDWLTEGGKVFATHSQSVWFQNGPSDFQSVAAWRDFSAALGGGVYSVNTTFPKGSTFEKWLGSVGAATGASISLSSVSDTVGSSSDAGSGWIDDPSSAEAGADPASTGDVKLLSFKTPIGGVSSRLLDGGTGFGVGVTTDYCGKAVFSDLHMGSVPTGDLPDSCPTGPLTAEERAMEFLLFDLFICVAPPPAMKGLPPQLRKAPVRQPH